MLLFTWCLAESIEFEPSSADSTEDNVCYLRESGKDHPDVGHSLNELAELHENRGDWHRATEYQYTIEG